MSFTKLVESDGIVDQDMLKGMVGQPWYVQFHDHSWPGVISAVTMCWATSPDRESEWPCGITVEIEYEDSLAPHDLTR